MINAKIKGILLDVGGVIMTNGWDRKLRQKVAENFHLDWEDFNNRHQHFNDILELGKIGFEDYLKQVIFYKERSFSMSKVFNFIKEALVPDVPMIDLFREIKKHHRLKMGLLSNESRDLAVDRFKKIPLGDFIDYFLVSAFVGMRKPDPGIYLLALDLMQLGASEVVYIDDREPYIEFAKTLGLHTIHHTEKEDRRSP